jgi:hypothetical protein
MALSNTETDPDQVNVEEYAGDTIRLETHILGVMNSPEIVEGKVSSTGKTIRATHPHNDEKAFRFDTATILAGEGEYRDSRTFSLYTYDTFQRTQRANLAPGPQAGANRVSDPEDLPNPTHEVVSDDRDESNERDSDGDDAAGETVAEGDRVRATGEADNGDLLDARGTVAAVTDSKSVVSLDDGRTVTHRGEVLLSRTDGGMVFYREATLERLGGSDDAETETAAHERGDAEFNENDYVAVRSTISGERHTVLGSVMDSTAEQTAVRLQETHSKVIIDADGIGWGQDGNGRLASDATIQLLEGNSRDDEPETEDGRGDGGDLITDASRTTERENEESQMALCEKVVLPDGGREKSETDRKTPDELTTGDRLKAEYEPANGKLAGYEIDDEYRLVNTDADNQNNDQHDEPT